MITTEAPVTDLSAPVRWLIAEYDATDLDACTRDESEESALEFFGSVHVQPIFSLKSVMDAGQSMRVTAGDYSDPGRWWL
jgi:hypothetical protein